MYNNITKKTALYSLHLLIMITVISNIEICLPLPSLISSLAPLLTDLADPVLRGVAWVLVWVGMCGASVQVAIFSDLLDLATLHLHCFYTYGAR